MSMQLFSFGHPCEHQLRRTCIGGTSCPLNGYPDAWCCSYIKGKINFKRDKPCEGPRCRWGFTHPTQQQFDEVTQVLSDSRPVAAKMDDAEDTDILSFHTESPHIVDTVQCALHMLRHPPSSCARRVGQLMAYGAVKSGDPKVFLQLLKTMKKPVDNYILGAYFYLTQGTPPTPTSGPNMNQTTTGTGNTGAKANKKGKADLPSRDDVVQELRNDLVDIMNAALSHAGHLVERQDQHLLQATFIQALRTYPKGNKRRQDMLEAAVQCFGNRQPPKDGEASPTTEPPAAAAAAPTPTEATAETAAAGATATATGGAVSGTRTASTTAPSTPGAATPMVSPEAPKTRASPALSAAVRTSTSTPPRTPTTPNILQNARLPTLAEVAAAASNRSGGHHAPQSTTHAGQHAPQQATTTTTSTAPSSSGPEGSNATVATAPTVPSPSVSAAASAGASATTAAAPSHAAPTATAQPSPASASTVLGTTATVSPHAAAAAAAAVAKAGLAPHTTMSRIILSRTPMPRPLAYDPLRVDTPLPNVFIVGGLFALSPVSTGVAPLGPASQVQRLPTQPAASNSGGGGGGLAATSVAATATKADTAQRHASFDPLFEDVEDHEFAPRDEEWPN